MSLSRNEGLLNAELKTNESGNAKVYLKSQNNLSYHYTLTNSATKSSSVKVKGGKLPLNRFVMMYFHEEEAIFDLQLPQKGSYILDIGVVEYPSAENCMKNPVHYINTCKLLITC